MFCEKFDIRKTDKINFVNPVKNTITKMTNANNNSSSNNQNNKLININQTTPAGFACLTLYYLQTKNSNILSKIRIPNNLYQLDSFKPFHLYLAILCKNLISWDNITSSINWVKENIPNLKNKINISNSNKKNNKIIWC